MIEFFYECSFRLENKPLYSDWITRVVKSENAKVGTLNYIYCDDAYLLEINRKFLSHNTYTDIISFDYTENGVLSGDIFISVERVRKNSEVYESTFEDELLRVMAHGVLHFLGYGDKSEVEVSVMRGKEEDKIKMFHVEH